MEWLSDLKFLPSKFYLGDTTIVNGNEMKMLSLKEMIENKFIGLNFVWNWKIAQEFMVFFSLIYSFLIHLLSNYFSESCLSQWECKENYTPSSTNSLFNDRKIRKNNLITEVNAGKDIQKYTLVIPKSGSENPMAREKHAHNRTQLVNILNDK